MIFVNYSGPSDGKIYLVDYGLVSSRFKSGVQKPFLPDERCACEGTLEFCSRDAHLGCKVYIVAIRSFCFINLFTLPRFFSSRRL